MNSTFRGLVLALVVACVSLATASQVLARAPQELTATARRPLDQAFPGFINVKLPAADAAALRAASTRGLTRMRAASPVADRVAAALQVRSMEPVLRTEFMFPEAVAFGLDRWFKLEVDTAEDVNVLVARAKAIVGVEWAEPDVMPIESTVAPNDSLFSKNWGHGNTGTFPSYSGGSHSGPNVGTVGFDTNVQTRWGLSAGYGASSVIIAIIDSGVNPGHPDLLQVMGYDAWNNDSIPNDQEGHGTACAGVAAGIANNSRGVAGAAGGCSIMGIRITNDAWTAYSEAGLVNGLAFAVTRGAKIGSMSFRIPSATLVSNAISAADSAGMLLFAATDNDNRASISYPASHAKVIAVGAAAPCGGRKRSASSGPVNPGVLHDSLGVSCDNETWWGSSYGPAVKDAANAVDILGPTILPSTDIQGAGGYSSSGYTDWFNGTLCATPYVAGVAALLRSQHPTWTPAQVRAQLMSTAIDIVDAQTPAGWDKYTGYGLVNAGLPDMAPLALGGWAKTVVPRPFPDGTLGSVPPPSFLNGDATTYVNVAIGNFGDAVTGPEDWALDAVGQLGPIDLAPFTGGYWNNLGVTITGGRHVLGQYMDVDNSAVEIDENNNRIAHQWVWTPVPLAQNALALRATPPDPMAGAPYLPVGETFHINQDAVRAAPPAGGTQGYWVVGVRGTDNGDADLYLYRPSTGVTNGFVPTSSIAFSGNWGGFTDFAWWKLGSPNTPANMDVGIAMGSFNGIPAGTSVENRASTIGVIFNGPDEALTNRLMAEHQAVAVHFLDVTAGGAGPITIELTTSLTGSLGAGVHIALISPADTAGSREDALQFSTTVNGVERLSRTLTPGLYGVVVFRDTFWEGMSLGLYDLYFRRTPAELVAGGIPGWYAPSVPFKSGVGSPTTAPTVLDGNVNNTIFAYGYQNASPSAASGFQATEYIDGQQILTWTPGAVAANGNSSWLSTTRNVRGGLHTMGFKNDVTNAILEFNEGNNNYSSQWVWSPLAMALGTPLTRSALPDTSGGWDDIPFPTPRYANVDGLRTPAFLGVCTACDNNWAAVALTPTNATTNPDLRAYGTLSSGPSSGFKTPDEMSTRGVGLTDVVLVDASFLLVQYDIGLYKTAGTGTVKTQAVSSKYLAGAGPSNSFGPFQLGPDSLTAVFQLDNATATNRNITVVNLSGNANLDFMLFGQTDPSRLYNPGQAAATASAGSDGSNENYVGSVPGKAALVVNKAGWSDVTKTARFRIDVVDQVTATDTELPTGVAFAPIAPNPARSDAALRFDLPREAHVDMDVYDVGGRRVSALSSQMWNAGRHSIRWNLRDGDGQPLSSGVYLVRFRSGDFERTQRVLVVR